MSVSARIRRSSVLLALPVTLAACAVHSDTVTGPAEEPSPGQIAGSFSLVTFNTGLAHGAIPFAAERRTRIADGLLELAADVLCLQEVWIDEDARAMTSALKPVYPFAYHSRTEGLSPRAAKCGPFKALKLDRCVKSDCTREGIAVLECVRGACKEPYEAVGQDCQRCLAANPSQSWRCASGLFRSDEYVYEGRNGLLLLSRHPIEHPEYTSFETALIHRGVIRATIAGHSVFCTHLTADLDAVPYPAGRAYSSFEEEQADQFRWLAEKTPTDGCAIVLGDLNSGPADASLVGEHPENYASILDGGFAEPWFARRCTLCQENPLAGSFGDLQLDHILLRNCAGARNPRYSRVLDRPFERKLAGEVREIPLSDHYGLRVEWDRQAAMRK